MDGLVVKRLLDKLRLAPLTLEHPGVDLGECVVMAKRFAFGGLVLDTEVPAARLLTSGRCVGVHRGLCPTLVLGLPTGVGGGASLAVKNMG